MEFKVPLTHGNIMLLKFEKWPISSFDCAQIRRYFDLFVDVAEKTYNAGDYYQI